jgi:hypothetical protein
MVTCCNIPNDTSSARLSSSTPTPTLEPPAVVMVRLRSTLSTSSPLQLDRLSDFYLTLDPLSLLCSRQI